MNDAGGAGLQARLEPWSRRVSAGFTLRGWHSPPSGRPVVHFVHGNGYCGLVYEAMLARLAERFDLFISDVQGHGGSDHGGVFRGWNHTAALCLEVWDHYAPLWAGRPAFGLGHSFGGVMTALMMARRPGVFRRTVLLDPVLFPPRLLGLMGAARALGLAGRSPLVERARRRRSHWPGREAAFTQLEGRGIFRGWEARCLRAYTEHALMDSDDGVVLRCRPEREAEIFASKPRGLWRSLRRIDTPVLMLHGRETYPFVIEAARRWPRVNPRVAAEARDGGHCFMQQAPDATAERIVDALDEPAAPCG